MQLILASNNLNKLREIQPLIPDRVELLSLQDAGIHQDIPEPFETLEANAIEKATVIFQLTGKNCFSEDTGLEVYALNGDPGVHSARYAGEDKDFEANIDLLLKNMEDVQNRQARFRTIICLLINEKVHLFEGICEGKITRAKMGRNGFGYDAVFIPEGSSKTFAEMTMEEKSVFSHRRKAVEKLIEFINTYYGKA